MSVLRLVCHWHGYVDHNTLHRTQEDYWQQGRQVNLQGTLTDGRRPLWKGPTTRTSWMEDFSTAINEENRRVKAECLAIARSSGSEAQLLVTC